VDIQEQMLAKTSNTTRLVDKLLKELVTRKYVLKTDEKIEVLITQKSWKF
jgi:DNA-binding MarR family transcriptional regulator